MTSRDGTDDKQAMRDYWTGKAAAWDRRADEIAELANRLNAPLLDALEIGPGQQVLDLASGAGEPALSIARRVAPGGRVVATDLVAEMLAGARRRAREAGLGSIDFQPADMEALPFADASFDRVTCRFGLMFCARPEPALAHARRVLQPGGRAGFMVWGPRRDTSLFEALAAAAGSVFGDGADEELSLPFRFGAAGMLAGRMRDAGFDDVAEHALRFAPLVPAGRRFWLAQADMSLGRRLEEATPREREAFHQAVAEALEHHRDGEAYRLSVHVRIGLGTVAAD